MPEINITSKIAKKTEKKEKNNFSSFLLTINLNQPYKDNNPNKQNDIEFFDELINDILNNINLYVKLPEGVQWSDETVKKVDADYVLEVGGKKNMLHTHILLTFTHTTNIKLDYKKIKDKIIKETGLNNIYLHNRVAKGNGNILEYIDKYV